MDDQAGRGAGALLAGWYAVIGSRALKAGPQRVMFNGQAYALWRNGGKLHAALDICPHRGAPLSMGRVVEGDIACPYHGWRFDGRGSCTRMPALDGTPPPAHVPVMAAAEDGGLVFVWWPGAGRASPTPDLPVTPVIARGAAVVMTGEVETTVGDFAENILDTTHTSVVHAGYLRGRDNRRPVVPEVVAGDGWIEARYPPDAAPDGVITRLTGGRGYRITDRFRAPNLCEVEYSRDGRMAFGVRFHLTPGASGHIRAFAVMAVAGGFPLAHLQVQLLKQLFRRIIAEDRVILNAVSANRAAFGRSPLYIAPQDLLRAGIDALLRSEQPVAASAQALLV